MLVLSRKNQESVVIVGPQGNECLLKVTVIDIQGRRVKLGFEAADHVHIRRSELWEQGYNASPPRNALYDGDIGRSEATDRWEDDGGDSHCIRSATAAPEARS